MDYLPEQQQIIDFLKDQKTNVDLSNPANFEKFKTELNTRLMTLSLSIPNQQPNAVSLFYAGDVGTGSNKILSWRLAVGMGEGSPGQVIVLQDTILGEVINGEDFKEITAELSKKIPEYGNYVNEIWDTASERMAQHAQGNVRALVPLTHEADKVFTRKELPALLQNPEVTHIENIDINVLRQHYIETFDALKAQNPALKLEELQADATREVQAGIAAEARQTAAQLEYVALKGEKSAVAVDSRAYFAQNPSVTPSALPVPETFPSGIAPQKIEFIPIYESYDVKQREYLEQGDRAAQRMRHIAQTIEPVSVEQLHGKITPPANTIDGESRYIEPTRPTITDTNPVIRNLRANDASEEMIQSVLNPKPRVPQPDTPFDAAHKQTLLNPNETEAVRTKRLTEPSPPLGMSTYDAHIAEQSAKQTAESKIINQSVVEAQARTDAAQKALYAEIHASKALNQGSHLAEGVVNKLGGKLGIAGAAITGYQVYNNATEATYTAKTNQEEWQKATAAVVTTTANEIGINDAATAATIINPALLVKTMVDERTFNPVTAVTQAAQKREEAQQEAGKNIGNSLYNRFSKEGGAKAEADKLTQALPNITDPEARKTAETLRDAFTEIAHEEQIKNQNRIAGVQGVVNTYDAFIAENPRYRNITKGQLIDNVNDLTDSGIKAEQAVNQGYTNTIRQQTESEKKSLSELSEKGQARAAEFYSKNQGASWTDAIEIVKLENKRDFVAPSFGGDVAVGEMQYQAKLAQVEEANKKADPTYGKDANDIRLQQQIEQAKAAEQAHHQLLKAVEKLDLDSKISYYQAKAVEQRKDPNHFAHPHDAASNVVHLQYQKKQQMEAQGHTNYRAYGKQAEHNQSNGAQHRPAPKPAELGMGASGQKVTNLQNVLKSLGADIVVDGHFGSTTRDAVKEFQREHNLKVDGKIGVNDAKVIGQAVQAKDAQQAITTLAQLNQRGMHLTDNKDGNNTSSSNDNSAAIQTLQEAKPKTYNLKQGAQGEQVHQIQLALNQLGHNVPTDGVLDKTTQDAVKAFQKEHGLQPDGAMNPKDTWQLAQAVDNHQRVQAQLAEQKQSLSPTQSITTPPVNLPDVNTPAAPAVSPEQSKQVEQMVSVLSTNPAFAALAPDVQMTMAAQAVSAAQAVNLNAQSETQPQIQPQTATVQVQNTPEPITQTAVPVMATMAQAELQPVMATPVQSSPVQSSPTYAAPAMTSPTGATSEVEPPARQTETISQSAQPIVLSPRIAKLHEQITHHLTQGEFGNQLAHLSDKDQQAAIALATHEATRNLARSVDYVQINKDGDVMMGFDGHKGFSAEMNLNQVQNNEANQVLAASMDLQQTQAQNLAMRQEQSRNQSGPTITM